MEKNKKKAAEILRQLLNVNCEESELRIDISYENCLSKTDTSLLIENK